MALNHLDKMGEKPLYKKFRTNNNTYLYDTYSNNILEVDNIIFDIVDDFFQYPDNFILRKWRFKYSINDIKRKLLLLKQCIDEKKYLCIYKTIFKMFLSKNKIKKILESKLEHMILEVTNNCNNRCKYCAYSGKYLYKRNHGKKKMSEKIGLESIDFFLERTSDNDETPCIGFYGGEPILNFSLVKKCIDYARKQTKKELSFLVSTNGTLLNLNIMKYFFENNVKMAISLDGPKEIHDRYRISLENKGTFKKVYNNIKLIKKLNEDYFKRNILINAVLAPPYNLNKIKNFFLKNPIFKDIKPNIKFSTVDPNDSSFFHEYGLLDCKSIPTHFILKARSDYENLLINNCQKEIFFERELFDKDYYSINMRIMTKLKNIYPPQGMCIPGKRRLYVDVQGNFKICEKVDNDFNIGNIKKGFDIDIIYNYLINFFKFFKECHTCWAQRLCLKCIVLVQKGAYLEQLKKKELCKSKLSSIERTLISYCSIREKNNNAFDFMNTEE